MLKHSLSIIIPFLNEGDEIFNTLCSIETFSSDLIKEIIIINDCSNDGYNYKQVANKFGAKYVENSSRMGVAASRDLGVSIANGKYVLFLDAHMRIYNSKWSEIIIEELSKYHDSNVILCCQTKALVFQDGKVMEVNNRPISYGNTIDFLNEHQLLECNWIFKEDESLEDCIETPCVFGAAYAFSKDTWERICGLSGLKQYGNDEAYMSMKAWLSGGKCMLLKNVTIGHIYRNTQPYDVDITYRIYNRLWIAGLLLDSTYRAKVFSYSKHYENYTDALFELYNNRNLFYRLKSRYKDLMCKDYLEYVHYNNSKSENTPHYNEPVMSTIIDSTKLFVIEYIEKLKNNSIENGRLGAVLFLSILSEFAADSELNDVVGKNIDEIINITNNNSSDICLSVDLGWVLSYLIEMLNLRGEIYRKRLVALYERIINILKEDYHTFYTNYNLILRFFNAIHYYFRQNNIYASIFERKVYEMCIDLIDNGIISIELLLFVFYYENHIIFKPSVYDVMSPPLVNSSFNPRKYNLGLSGSSGVALKLIIDKSY